MGLREEAEKIMAEQDAQRHTVEHENLTTAREQIPEELAAWCSGMQLDEVPDYTVMKASYHGRDDDDYPSALIRLAFEVDGIRFFADLKYYRGRATFKVTMRDASDVRVQTVKDVATGLRVMKSHEP